MSLIYTAELSGINPFDYLTQLLKHPEEVRRNRKDTEQTIVFLEGWEWP